MIKARAAIVLGAAVAVAVAFATAGGGSPGEPTESGPIRLGFLYSTDTEDLLEPLIQEFNAGGFRQSGRKIVVEGEAIESGRAETGIEEGRMKPVLWGPASSLWGRLLNHHVDDAWVADENPSIVLSPQVIAMWEPVARALGWPEASIGWTDILALATDPSGWASRGRPHYGAFKLGHTNANSSTSGLSAVAAMYYAIAGGLTAADVARPDVRAAVRDIEQSIVDYAKTADDFLVQMGRLGTDYAHAVAVQERSLVLFNEESPDARLVAVYPSEGTFVADYPLIVLHAPWVDAEERLAAEIFQNWLLPQITPELVAPFGYRAPGSHRTVPPIDEAHGADPNQPQRILPPPAPDVIATIQDNWNEDRKPANVVLVVDTSASVGREGLLRPQQEALGAFLDALRPADRVGLVTFASEVFEPVPVVSFSAGENDLRETIRDLIPGEASSLYDAVHTGFSTLRTLADDSRVNVVVVVSDGADDASSRTLDELVHELEDACENGPLVIPVIAVAYGDDADTEALEHIAAACPGRTLPATPEDVVDVLRTVALLF